MHVDRQTHRQTDMMEIVGAFGNCVNVLKCKFIFNFTLF